jgi:hypothetical protein
LQTFGRWPGVVGLGSGFAWTRNSLTNEPVLRVIVRRKRPLWEVRRAERIPSSFEGLRVVVCEPVASSPIASRALPLQGGLQIESRKDGLGTLGCFATIGSGTQKQTVLLTAGHVLTDSRGVFAAGGDVGSPDLDSSWCCTTGLVGAILKGRVDDQFDCGLATLNTDRPKQQVINGLGPDLNGQNTDLITGVAPPRLDPDTGVMAPVIKGDHVRKVGATTGRTGGTVLSVDFPIPADPDAELPEMQHQIVLGPVQAEGKKLADGLVHFASEGDSGAAIMDDQNRVAALLIRKANLSGQSAPPWVGFGGVGIDINRITTELGITIFPSSTPIPTQATRALVPGLGIYKLPGLSGEQLARRNVIEAAKAQLRQFELGRRLIEFLARHESEIRQLVNHDRRVTIAWHRARGPAFLAILLRDLRELESPLPASFDGLSVSGGLSAVHSAVAERGSPQLVADMSALWEPVRSTVERSSTVQELIDNLRGAVRHA